MFPSTRVPGRLTLGVCGLLAALGIATAQQPQQQPREKQIADLEKQLQDLTKRLTTLKSQPATETPVVSNRGGLNPDWVKALHWRPLGPANMSGRIVAMSVFEADPSTYWVATASGGLLKTVNNGITFEHQFDREATVSIGDVAVAPSDRNIVWVGTGENNPRNSVSYGDGVYKSIDGGKTWRNMGLKGTYQVGKILVHPKDPNTVYVGALGRLYGLSQDRGIYKTTDGGISWKKVLYIDDKTGIIDMRLHPTNPDVIVAASWERQRDAFDGFFGDFEGDQYGPIKTHAAGTALYKTNDGGGSWKKLTKGLPTAKMGRIGLDWYLKDPKILYAIIDTEKAGMTTAGYLGVQAGEKSEGGLKLSQVTENGPAAKAGIKTGDLLLTLDGKALKDSADLTAQLAHRVVGDKVKLTIQSGTTKKEVELVLAPRPAQTQGRGGAGGGGGGGGMAGMLLAGFIGEDTEEGIRVARLLGEESSKAGLREGDLVTAIEGKAPNGFRETFQNLSSTKKAGDKVKVTIDRDGKKQDLELSLASPLGGGRGGASARRPFSSTLGGQTANIQEQQGRDGFQTGGIFQSSDEGESWVRINSLNPRPMYFSQVRVDPSDNKNLYVLGVSIARSSDGGKSFQNAGGGGVHADQHTLWINPRDGRHMVVGCDGGTYVTYDRMANWDHLNHHAIGQFYHVAVDSRRPYRVYGGLQDNGSWGGPAEMRTATGAVNEDWLSVGGGDGFTCRVDPNDPDLIYWTSQNGNMGRRNLRTGESASIRPRQGGGGGAGGRGAGGGGTGGGGQGGASRYRFNWNTPFILSNHNSRIFYAAGNYVFRSLDRGNNLEIISPEITLTKAGSATALSESPRNPNVLYAGTDDGGLWITKDGGKSWSNINKNVGLKGPLWVSTIEASRFDEGRCYVVFDGHRSDDDNPHVYMTEDFGQTWKSLKSNLSWGSTRVLREDLKNPNLLYLGTEFGAWASVNRGSTWTRINANLPTVAIHEFAQHPTAGEMVAATHGRSLWAVDVTPLRGMTSEALSATAYLYPPNSVIRWKTEPARGRTNRRFVAENPKRDAGLFISLNTGAKEASLKIYDINNKLVRELSVPKTAGLHRVSWDLGQGGARQGIAGAGGRGGAGRGGAGGGAVGGRGAGRGAPGGQAPAGGAAPGGAAPGAEPGGEGTETAQAGPPQGFGGPGGGLGGGFGFGRTAVPPGSYRVVLTVDGKEVVQTLRIEADPSGNAADLIASEMEENEDP